MPIFQSIPVLNGLKKNSFIIINTELALTLLNIIQFTFAKLNIKYYSLQ